MWRKKKVDTKINKNEINNDSSIPADQLLGKRINDQK